MYIAVSISLFFVVAVLYILIIDIFTMFFRATGMTEEKARFQVISLLTNSGYTTSESEVVVEVLARRRLARKVMMFGYIFSITIVSVLINLLISLPSTEAHEVWPVLLAVSAIFVAFLLIKRIPPVRQYFNAKLQSFARRRLHKKGENMIIALDEYPRGLLAEVVVEKVPQSFAGRTLREVGLQKNYHLHLTLLRRGEEMFSEDMGDMAVQPGDRLLLFGKIKDMEGLFTAAED